MIEIKVDSILVDLSADSLAQADNVYNQAGAGDIGKVRAMDKDFTAFFIEVTKREKDNLKGVVLSDINFDVYPQSISIKKGTKVEIHRKNLENIFKKIS